MTIGTLGTVTFQTDAKTVETFENLSIKKSANFVAHNYTYRDGQLLQCTVGVTIVENGVSA